MRDEDQHELIRAAPPRRRRAAFDELVRLKRERSCARPIRSPVTWTMPLDVAQGVFVKLWQGLVGIDPNGGSTPGCTGSP